MNIHEEKLDIIQWLAGINDRYIIEQIKALKESSKDVVGSFTQEEKEAIDRGLKSIEQRHVKSHEDVMDLAREKYSDLFK